jgi:hypothetical protein
MCVGQLLDLLIIAPKLLLSLLGFRLIPPRLSSAFPDTYYSMLQNTLLVCPHCNVIV